MLFLRFSDLPTITSFNHFIQGDNRTYFFSKLLKQCIAISLKIFISNQWKAATLHLPALENNDLQTCLIGMKMEKWESLQRTIYKKWYRSSLVTTLSHVYQVKIINATMQPQNSRIAHNKQNVHSKNTLAQQ